MTNGAAAAVPQRRRGDKCCHVCHPSPVHYHFAVDQLRKRTYANCRKVKNPRGQSGLLTYIDGKRFVCAPDEKLHTFVELEVAVRIRGKLP